MGAAGEARAAILLVAEDADYWDALAEVLDSCGDEVAAARDGGEALEYLHTQPHPCLILLDIAANCAAGHELLTTLKADSRLTRLPVVLLTGTEEANAFSHFSGAVLSLSKRVTASTLLKVASIYCRRLTAPEVAPDPPPDPRSVRRGGEVNRAAAACRPASPETRRGKMPSRLWTKRPIIPVR